MKTKTKDKSKIQLSLVQKKEAPKPYNEQRTYKQLGGTYSYSAGIIAHKNIFVTAEYLDVLANAFQLAELKHNVKNLAYVVMPNHFYWVFKLSDTADDPVPVYRDLKKTVALEILNLLREEAKDETSQLPLFGLFTDNEKVTRSNPRKILWTFKEEAKKMDLGRQRYRVWDTSAKMRLLENDEQILKTVQYVSDAPLKDRWELVADASEYPYLYISAEMQEKLTA